MIVLPYGEKLWQYVKPFSSDTGTSRTDRQTDGRTDRIAISISRVSVLTRDQNWCHKVMLFTSLRWSVCSCLLPLQHYEKTSTVLKIDGQGQYYWDRAIKFTRWQHSAMRRRARFDTSGTSCLILVYSAMNEAPERADVDRLLSACSEWYVYEVMCVLLDVSGLRLGHTSPMSGVRGDEQLHEQLPMLLLNWRSGQSSLLVHIMLPWHDCWLVKHIRGSWKRVTVIFYGNNFIKCRPILIIILVS